VTGDHVVVEGEEVDVPFEELGPRLAEAAVARILPALQNPDGMDRFWVWESPLQAIEAMLAQQKAGKP
jgi:hypothetical protein